MVKTLEKILQQFFSKDAQNVQNYQGNFITVTKFSPIKIVKTPFSKNAQNIEMIELKMLVKILTMFCSKNAQNVELINFDVLSIFRKNCFKKKPTLLSKL